MKKDVEQFNLERIILNFYNLRKYISHVSFLNRIIILSYE